MKITLAPILLLAQRFRIELIFSLIASITILASLGIFFASSHTVSPPPMEETKLPEPTPANKIYIDVGGAVQHPDVYEVNEKARLKDVLKMAGGFNNDADRAFISKNFNLAETVQDQEKVYVPSTQDTANGGTTTFITKASNTSTAQQVNINTASADELDGLPGVGTTTVQKIVDNRPYTSIYELVTKKIISSSTFDKVQDLITL